MGRRKKSAPPVLISEYTDYRDYLKCCIATKREAGENVTNRSISDVLGINSSSWLTNILAGKRNLTSRTAAQMSEFLEHTPWEKAFFLSLVKFNQARDLEKRNYAYQQMCHLLSKRGKQTVTIVGRDHYEYYSKWYYSSVRALIAILRVKDDYELIARNIVPSITLAQAQKAVQLLSRLGMIERDSDGFWKVTEKSLSTGQNIRSLSIMNFQRETMQLGVEALDRFTHGVRDISTLTVGISEQDVKKVIQTIAECRKKIVDIAQYSEKTDRVYQINFQAFPTSLPQQGQTSVESSGSTGS